MKVKDEINKILGKPVFDGNRTWIWKSDKIELSIIHNIVGNFSVLVYTIDNNLITLDFKSSEINKIV